MWPVGKSMTWCQPAVTIGLKGSNQLVFELAGFHRRATWCAVTIVHTLAMKTRPERQGI
jgi:hypothetical protein